MDSHQVSDVIDVVDVSPAAQLMPTKLLILADTSHACSRSRVAVKSGRTVEM